MPANPPNKNNGAANGEERLVLLAGQEIFRQGDVGGDLYFIQQGEVEIYTPRDGHDVALTTMKEGEVIGLLSCMTREPRLASARAKSDCVIRKVRYETISGAIKTLPQWMKIVLKEFSIRLTHTNKLYSEATSRVKLLRASQLSRVYTSMQLAGAIATCAEFKKLTLDEVPAVLPEAILDTVEPILARSREELDEIFQVFVDTGMIKLLIEQERKRKYFTYANALKLKTYCDFVRQAERGKTRKLVQAQIAHREHRVLSGLVRYAVALKLDLNAQVKLAVTDLQKSMKRATGQDFEADACEISPKLGLVSFEGDDTLRKICFVPSALSHTLTHLAAFNKLQKLDELALTAPKDDKSDKDKKAS